MFNYILKRLILIIPTLFLILLTNFAIIQSAPGGPVEQKIAQIEDEQKHGVTGVDGTTANKSNYQGSRGLSPAMVEAIKQQYGFDKSAPERFWLMVTNYARLDFGKSFFKGKPVTELLLEKMPVSVSLGLWSTLLIYLIAIPLGIAKATRHNSLMDKSTALLLAVSYAVPVFVLAVVLLVLLAGGEFWQIFPLQGLVSENFDKLSTLGKIKDYFWHLALPLTASTIGGFAGLAYLTKFSFMEELSKQYVLTARSKGLSEKSVLYGHVFRNAMLIIIAGLPSAIVGIFFTGNFLIEVIFNLDGLGRLGFEAIQQRDYPVIFGTLFIFTLMGLVLQLVSDVTYTLIDPRIDFDTR